MEEEKEQFFNALYLLDDVSDDEVAPLLPPMPLQGPLAANILQVMPLQQPFAASFATEVVPLQQRSASIIASEAGPTRKPTRKTRGPTTARPLPPLLFPKCNKRKKTAKSTTISEAHRIFTGSIFYFIPNDDVAAPRKMRIQRALQYGAVWEKIWSAAVTHVIVDSSIMTPDVLKHFRRDKLPVRTVSPLRDGFADSGWARRTLSSSTTSG